MLLKPWHFLFPFHSERLIKLSPVPRQYAPLYLPARLPPTRRPGRRFPSSCGGAGAGAGAVPQGRCRRSPGAGGPRGASAPPPLRRPHPRPPLPAQPGISTDRGLLQSDPRVSPVVHARAGSSPRGISREGHRPPARPLREAPAAAARPRTDAPAACGGEPAPRPPRSCKLKVNPAAPRSPPGGRSPLPGPAAAPPPRSRRRPRAGRAGGAAHLPQPAAPPGAKPRRRPRHLHGDIRSTAGALSGAGARRRPACCGGLGGGWELWLRPSRGPGTDHRRHPPAASRLRPRRGSARV